MKLVINNHIISYPIKDIIYRIRDMTNNEYLTDIKSTGNSIMVTCPFHNNHSERHPSCGIDIDENSPTYGWFHCFTCGTKGDLVKLTSYCLNITTEKAKQWLIDNFSDIFSENKIILPEIILNSKPKTEYLDESILDKFNYYHPYMDKRKISPEVRREFKIGFNKETNAITFPVWDSHNNLIFISERSVFNKSFKLGTGKEKPVYLLNFIKNKDIKEVIICEGQIDALVAWSYGVPAVALLGAGTTKNQIDELNKTNINHFILMYDNDLAGKHGALRFNSMIDKSKLVTTITMPENKDIADCDRDEFFNILKENNINIDKYLFTNK